MPAAAAGAGGGDVNGYYTPEEMDARVEALLVEMRLAKCADTQCGGTDPLYTAVRCCVGVLLCLCDGRNVVCVSVVDACEPRCASPLPSMNRSLQSVPCNPPT